ncbi:FAD-dependent monooxygenase [Actinomadura soli]|uniref:FAD-dependent monooxygenase n=1 Tax=Actinomadura soli TaxID=2508997 RepID=A0A5C4J7W1_9ACTN|nr:FAD-dependent monooxygenase [Actinomadura soli]TMQ94921.1 FAD-dependent monooxygenase [Actinomadura soli]
MGHPDVAVHDGLRLRKLLCGPRQRPRNRQLVHNRSSWARPGRPGEASSRSPVRGGVSRPGLGAARRTGGKAVLIWSNGTAVLHDLGIALDGAGNRIDRIDALTSDGRLRTTQDIAHTAARFGFETKAIARRDLMDRLADGLPGGLVRYGMTCERISQDGDRVTATFGDGSSATGDLLIGADGHHSIVRRHLWGDGAVRPATFGTWQGLSPIDVDLTGTHRHYMITGREGACGLMPAGDGLLQWWFDVRWSPADPRPASPLSGLRRRFGHWAAPVPEVLAAATDDDLEFFGHHWNKVRRVWGDGRITLVGDAAHTMPPTLDASSRKRPRPPCSPASATASAPPRREATRRSLRRRRTHAFQTRTASPGYSRTNPVSS